MIGFGIICLDGLWLSSHIFVYVRDGKHECRNLRLSSDNGCSWGELSVMAKSLFIKDVSLFHENVNLDR